MHFFDTEMVAGILSIRFKDPPLLLSSYPTNNRDVCLKLLRGVAHCIEIHITVVMLSGFKKIFSDDEKVHLILKRST